MNMTRKHFLVFVVFMLIGVGIVACGGDSAPEEVDLAFEGLDTLRFVPDSASVPANTQINVTLTNAGSLEHDWVLVSPGIDLATADASDAIGGANSGVVPGGETRTFGFTSPPAGTYQFICIVPGHALAGMVGTFTVTP
jgi:nitrite reductase (NO-forming)